MLGVLKFKKSLFAGVLDGGDKEVFLGGSRLTKFMETVEKTTSSIPAADQPDAFPEPARRNERTEAEVRSPGYCKGSTSGSRRRHSKPQRPAIPSSPKTNAPARRSVKLLILAGSWTR